MSLAADEPTPNTRCHPETSVTRVGCRQIGYSRVGWGSTTLDQHESEDTYLGASVPMGHDELHLLRARKGSVRRIRRGSSWDVACFLSPRMVEVQGGWSYHGCCCCPLPCLALLSDSADSPDAADSWQDDGPDPRQERRAGNEAGGAVAELNWEVNGRRQMLRRSSTT